jgi:lambda family phage tail tape measure protein
MADVIGKGVIEVSADASGLKAGINDAKTSLQQLKEAAASAGDTLTGQSTRYLQSLEKQAAALERQAATFGKSKAEIAAYNVAQLGVAATASTVVARIDAAEKSLRAQAAAAKEATTATTALGVAQQKTGGVSPGQTAAALRQLPAQFTDIVTSLQGGQSPLTVLLQQGGQVKDSFGGVTEAAKALGGYVGKLIGPFTLAAAAAGGLAIAFFQGRAETKAYQSALITTGNYAGVTSGQLSDMARAISQSVGTQGQAAAALAALAASGRLAGVALRSAATAAVDLEKATGQSIEKTVDQFVQLAEAPAAASLKLNETLHYLNQSTYERIAALEQQGRKEEAAALAQKTYADAAISRFAEVRSNMGYLERAFQSLGEIASKAWDKVKDVGRVASDADVLDDLRTRLAAKQQQGPLNDTPGVQSSYNKGIAALNEQISAQEILIRDKARFANLDKDQASAQQAAIRATDELNKQIDSSATKQEKMNKALAEAKQRFDAIRAVNPGSALLGKEQQTYANIREQFADKAAPGRENTLGKAQLDADLAALKASLEARNDAYKNADSIFAARRAAGLVTDKQFYEQERVDLELNEANQLRGLNAEKARLEQQTFAGDSAAAKEIDNQKAIGEIVAKIGKVKADTAAQAQVFAIQERAAADSLAASYIAARNAAEQFLQTLIKQGQRQVQAVGQSDKQRNYSAGINQIEDRYTQQRLDLENTRRVLEAQTDDKGNSKFTTTEKAKYDAGLALLNEYEAKATASYAQTFQAITAEEGKWENGATRAFQNYLDSAANVADQTNQLFTDAFSGIEDALATFVTTGKLSFTSLVNSIIADLVKMEVKAAASSIFKSMSGAGGLLSFLGGSGGGAGAVGSISDAALLSAGWAKGGAFSNGVQKFADGDVFGKPTMFGLGGGRLGVMGEAGPEAIMPLTRGKDGKLGVASQGGGGVVQYVTNNIGSNLSRQEVAQGLQQGMRSVKGDILEIMRNNKVLG